MYIHPNHKEWVCVCQTTPARFCQPADKEGTFRAGYIAKKNKLVAITGPAIHNLTSQSGDVTERLNPLARAWCVALITGDLVECYVAGGWPALKPGPHL